MMRREEKKTMHRLSFYNENEKAFELGQELMTRERKQKQNKKLTKIKSFFDSKLRIPPLSLYISICTLYLEKQNHEGGNAKIALVYHKNPVPLSLRALSSRPGIAKYLVGICVNSCMR